MIESRIEGRLARLYGEDRAPGLMQRVQELIARHRRVHGAHRLGSERWDESSAVLITYGDSIQAPGMHPLASLKDFLDRRLQSVFSLVHVLPFFPYSSDDGFAVSDFRAVNPALGDWEDIWRLGEHFGLMFDLVLNHMSREHLWFVNYVLDQDPGRDYVIEVDPAENLSMVVRPRSTPLLSRVRTPRGIRHVWATFSNDQIDLNYANPEVLLEFIDILLYYLQQGAHGVRLDAVAFLWKEIGTSCIHLPQTHEVVKLFRDIFDLLEPGAILLTETNVPHAENISYFGKGDEAHMVYQFSLAPLILHAIHTGSTAYLSEWATGLEQTPLPSGCTYLNFTASHDGVGLRPLEGIVPEDEVMQLTEDMRARGGYVTLRASSDGRDRPYELNISYFDAFLDPDDPGDPGQASRFLLSQTIPLSLQGIPACYVNALTATPNDPLGVERTGMTRSINRRKWDMAELEYLLDDPQKTPCQVFEQLVRRIRLRKRFPALHPEAPQRILSLADGLFGVLRESRDGQQRLLALHNCRAATAAVPLDDLPLVMAGRVDELSGLDCRIEGAALMLAPYQAQWVVEDARPAQR